MQRQREAARKAWAGSGEAVTEEVWFDVREESGGSEFLGYDTEAAEGVIASIVVDGQSAGKTGSWAKWHGRDQSDAVLRGIWRTDG